MNRGASGTLEKPQKSRSSLQMERKRMSRESVGIEKIFWRMREGNRIALENNIENSLEQGILETNIDIKMLKMTLNSVVSGKKFFMSGSGSTI